MRKNESAHLITTFEKKVINYNLNLKSTTRLFAPQIMLRNNRRRDDSRKDILTYIVYINFKVGHFTNFIHSKRVTGENIHDIFPCGGFNTFTRVILSASTDFQLSAWL